MARLKIYNFFYAFTFILLLNCGTIPVNMSTQAPKDRVIKFSGLDWIVRTNPTVKKGPGPNLFSDSEENVWVDDNGKLHLKITQRDGNWYCAGVFSKNSFGHGKYTFYVNSDVTKLDKNVVAGLFTYYDDSQEIDIEFSKWSLEENMIGQYAVQPSSKPGNINRFDIPENAGPTIHSFNWNSNAIYFFSRKNTSSKEEFAQWNYTGADIPSALTERLRLNLWLYKGQVPSDLKEQEIVIDSVKFEKQS